MSALCTRVFRILFPTRVTCVDEVAETEQLKSRPLPLLCLQEGESPAHSPPPALHQPARHTPDLNGQQAVQGRQCLDRTQVLIRELRVGLGWQREQMAPVRCFGGILPGLESLFASHLQKSLVSLRDWAWGYSPVAGTRSKDCLDLPTIVGFLAAGKSSCLLTSWKSFLTEVLSEFP